jgi:hypothetical protein
MSISSDSAEQLIRLYFEGAEFLLKISGSATKNIVAALYAMSKDKKASKGKTRLINMLKSDKELKIFSIKKNEMKIFAKQAKGYGVLYCALINKKNKNFDDMVDIMVRAEDAPKINRIIERFNLTTVDKAKIVQDEINKELQEKQKGKDVSENTPDKGIEEKNVDDKMIDDIFSEPIQKEEKLVPLVEEIQKESLSENFSESKRPLSDGTTKPIEKKSVKKQLAQYKAEEKLENEMKKQVEKAKETQQPVTKLKDQVSKVPVSKIQKEKGK